MSIKLTERTTNILVQNYWMNNFKHNFQSGRIKELFDNYEPDGIDKIQDGYIIIENKQTFEKRTEGINQLKRYFETFRKHDTDSIIYGVLSMGTQTLFIEFFDESLKSIPEANFKKLIKFTDRIQPKITSQQIHNILVKNFVTQDPKEISNVLMTILLTFESDDFIREYEFRNDISDNFFKNMLIDFVKRMLGDISIQCFDNIHHKNLFKVCKELYLTWKSNRQVFKQIYQQFRKYFDDKALKNNVWTPSFMSDFMNILYTNFYKDYIKKPLKVLDHCYGSGNLEEWLCENIKDIEFLGIELEKKIFNIAKMDFKAREINGRIISEDCFQHDFTGEHFDVCFINPPYTTNVSGHEPFDFIRLIEPFCDVIVAIMQTRKIGTFETHQKRLQIDFGKKVFKLSGTGDISVVIADNYDMSFEFKRIDCSLDDCKWVPHQNSLKLSQNVIKTMDMIQNLRFDEIAGNIRKVKSFKESVDKSIRKFSVLSSIESFDEEYQNEILEYLISNFQKDSITEEFFISSYESLKNIELAGCLVEDCFEVVKMKTRGIHEMNHGEYPLISSSKNNNGVAAMIDSYDIDIEEEVIAIARNGSVGFCSVHSGKFSITQDVMILKPLFTFNLKITSVILSIILPKIFDYEFKITWDRLKSVEIFIC